MQNAIQQSETQREQIVSAEDEHQEEILTFKKLELVNMQHF